MEGKLAWVLLPLAVAALAVLVLAAWRGRAPSRHGLNVGASLLLLAYVLTTAGLGIFWVANQQLPVFDWHYLFGYATVLLLVVHLSFNLRIVWQHLRRKRVAAPPPRAAPDVSAGPARRPFLGAAGAAGFAAAAGLGYFVGLRHGRTELQLGGTSSADRAETASARPDGTAGTAHGPEGATGGTKGGTKGGVKGGASADAAAAARAWAVVERFHAFSGHSRTRVLRHAASTDWGSGPPPFKLYAGAERVALPMPSSARLDAASAASAASATPTTAAPDLAALGSWLWHTTGISERRGGIALRTSPSSGALFATELYVLALDVRGLAAGPWHYDPEGHALQRVPQAPERGRDAASVLAAFGPLALPAGCHAVVVASAIFARSGHKYGDRTYRYVLADLGHALENLRVAVRAQAGLEVRLLAQFDEQALGAALGLAARHEGVLAVAAPAPAGTAPARVPAGTGHEVDQEDQGDRTSALRPAALGDVERLGLTEAMQRATSLTASSAIERTRAQGPASRAPTAAPTAASTAAATAAATAASTAAPAPTPVPSTRAAPPGVANAGAPWPAPGAAIALPAARTVQADVLSLIARRRSRRRFSSQPVPAQALADLLQAMTQPAPVLSPAVRIDVLTAAVTGLEAAAWRFVGGGGGGGPAAQASAIAQGGQAAPAASGLLQRRIVHGPALRARARAAALDQDVIGEAAVVFVLSLDRAALRADPCGAARGYRHGFIEAGLVGERIYLAAGALGLATCAVGAFYDDEAAALVGLDAAREWVVHFAALGLPG